MSHLPAYNVESKDGNLTLAYPCIQRPVDFEKRAKSLDDIRQGVDNNHEGLIKKLVGKEIKER